MDNPRDVRGLEIEKRKKSRWVSLARWLRPGHYPISPLFRLRGTNFSLGFDDTAKRRT